MSNINPNNEEETFNYFAYGSSLDFEAFEGWAKQHSHDMINLTNYELAFLPNHAIIFNINSKFWSGGVASLQEEANQTVEGISINLPSSLIDLIRQKEGVPNNLYYEKEVYIKTIKGEEKKAVVYIGVPSKVDNSVVPSQRFTQALIKGAQARGLSNQWIEKLQSLIPNNNNKEENNNNNNLNNNNKDNNNNDKDNDNKDKPVVTEEKLSSLLNSVIPSVFLKVKDESSGCGSKFSVIIVSETFEGVSLVNRHRKVNDTVKDLMPFIHALSLKTWTPSQYSSKLAAGESF